MSNATTPSAALPVDVQGANIQILVSALLGAGSAAELFAAMEVDARLLRSDASLVTRAELAQALNMVLFADLLARVPEGAAYVREAVAQGRKINFDHGALRTVVSDASALPTGYLAFARLLEPLGYQVAGLYPLPRLHMTGRAFAHKDFPAQIAQFFVSELHVDQFSHRFQASAHSLMATAVDPLSAEGKRLLAKLAEDKFLNLAEALHLLPVLVSCFARTHATVARADYEILLAESAEMAWIATEGSAYNHVTDRISDVFAVTAQQRALGRSIKDKVEISANGRVRQTAFKAAQIDRAMIESDGSQQFYKVPGSFYEFISRDAYYDNQIDRWCLDLTFDSSNATGIFKMTDAQSQQKAA